VVTWEGDFSNVAVMLKGVELGRVKDQQALLRGANFRLPDRANLRVQLLKKPVGKILTVARNGHRLPAIAGPEAPIKTGADQLFLLAILNFVPGVMMLLARERDLFGMGAGLVATGLLLGALGLWGTRRFAAPFWIGAVLLFVNLVYSLAASRNSDNPLVKGAGFGAFFWLVACTPALVRAAMTASNLKARSAAP